MVAAATFLAGGFQLAVAVYLLIIFTGMARNLARQGEDIARIARILERNSER